MEPAKPPGGGAGKKSGHHSGLLHGSSDSGMMLARRGSASLRETGLRSSQKLLNLGMLSGGFTVEAGACEGRGLGRESR